MALKPISQDKSHCFKHACTYPAVERQCPYCMMEFLKHSKKVPTDFAIDAAIEKERGDV